MTRLVLAAFTLLSVAGCSLPTPPRPDIIAITNEAAVVVDVSVVNANGQRQHATTLSTGESLSFDLGTQGPCGAHDLYIVTLTDGREVGRLESPSCATDDLTIT